MSVILAATSLAGQDGNFSPQHQNNWSISIYGLAPAGAGALLNGTDPLTFALRRGSLPTVNVDDVTIPFGNEEVHVAGRARYETFPLELNDYVDQDIQKLVAAWYGTVYGGVQGRWGVVGVPSAYKRLADLLFTAPDGEQTFPTRAWRLQGLWPVQGSFGTLDMGSSEVVQIGLTMRYDRAQYMGSGTSITSLVP